MLWECDSDGTPNRAYHMCAECVKPISADVLLPVVDEWGRAQGSPELLKEFVTQTLGKEWDTP